MPSLGCGWNMPGNYSNGFSSCEGDPTQPMGVYTTKVNGVVSTTTFHQGDPVTPPAHPAGKTSSCTYYTTLPNAENNAPASSPTASLLPSSVSASLSRASVQSVSTLSAESVLSTSSVGAATSFTGSTSRSGSGSLPSSTSSSNSASSVRRVAGAGMVPQALVATIGGLAIGGWMIALI